jgi:hypothetical protein
MRNTACEHYNKTLRDLVKDKQSLNQEFTATRSLKECIKPNNVMDNEVKECMQGLREPEWVTAQK